MMSEQNENKNTELDPILEENKEFSDVVENVQESREENSALLEDENKADGEEAEAPAQEGETSASQEESLGEDAVTATSSDISNGSTTEAVECSCRYEPPYGEPVSPEIAIQKKPKKSAKGLIALIIAISIVLAFIAGAVAGQWFLENDSKFPIPAGNDGHGSQTHSTFSAVVEEVAGSVVEIEGSGSGVIIDERGYILTNEHVVSDFVTNKQKIVVVLHDGKTKCVAEYVGGDAKYDIAVLKIETSEALSVAKIGKSSDLKVGDEVLAIGNPLATLGGTVTNGIISAKDRQIRVEHSLMTLLQTNAEINPGNSGGGLFNMSGELIGIVNAKQFATGIEGLGFAIPIDLAWGYAQDIMEYGYVTGKPYIGISFVENAKGGVYITSSTNELLKEGDQILVIDGNPINKISDMYPTIDAMKVGDVIKMTVQRDGTQLNLEIEVVEYKPAQ
ncbi:MAG: trypsin-like peptidase domain-containing protein [Clostridia bacterium]|nr:trypsin-like peptidase domain-containing protein [Clostridia bacterium]